MDQREQLPRRTVPVVKPAAVSPVPPAASVPVLPAVKAQGVYRGAVPVSEAVREQYQR